MGLQPVFLWRCSRSTWKQGFEEALCSGGDTHGPESKWRIFKHAYEKCVCVCARFKVLSLMSLQVWVKYSLLDAVLCVLECGGVRACSLACATLSLDTFHTPLGLRGSDWLSERVCTLSFSVCPARRGAHIQREAIMGSLTALRARQRGKIALLDSFKLLYTHNSFKKSPELPKMDGCVCSTRKIYILYSCTPSLNMTSCDMSVLYILHDFLKWNLEYVSITLNIPD